MSMDEAKKVQSWVEEAVMEAINSRMPTKCYIYESSSFTVPYDTVARIIAVGKGGNTSLGRSYAGGGGGTAVKIAKLEKGKKITITLDDEKTSAAYSDWVISGYNGTDGKSGGNTSDYVGKGGAAEGGGEYSTSLKSVIVGSDVQLIAGGNGGQSNAISKCGSGDSAICGGASYFGGNGGCNDSNTNGKGGDGLYGGGNGVSIMGKSSTVPAGNGGNSIYGYGGRGGDHHNQNYKAGDGGYGGILGGEGGLGYNDTTRMTNNDGVNGLSGIYKPLFGTPAQTPIGSGAGKYTDDRAATTGGVGAVIIELGESRFLDTYV